MELKLMRFDPTEFFTFLDCKVKRNQLIFGNRRFDDGFDVLANKIMFEFHKREKTNELIAQKGDKTKKSEFAHVQR